MDAAKLRKQQLMALPSVSCSLSQLPQARTLEQVSLHPSSMSAQLAAESEAKVRFSLPPPYLRHPCLHPQQLRKVLSNSNAPSYPSLIVTPPPNLSSSPSPQLTMKVCGHNLISCPRVVPNLSSSRVAVQIQINLSPPCAATSSVFTVHRLSPTVGTVSTVDSP